jgi:hypothetical protein
VRTLLFVRRAVHLRERDAYALRRFSQHLQTSCSLVHTCLSASTILGCVSLRMLRPPEDRETWLSGCADRLPYDDFDIPSAGHWVKRLVSIVGLELKHCLTSWIIIQTRTLSFFCSLILIRRVFSGMLWGRKIPPDFTSVPGILICTGLGLFSCNLISLCLDVL